jgi:hypothetical protein
VDPPFRVDALERGVVVFRLELGCHGWGEDPSWFDRRLGRNLDDLNGEVMADMDDATGQRVALGAMSCLEAGDLGTDVGEGGRRERVGVGVHGIHVGVALVQEGVTADGKGSAKVEWHGGGVAMRSVTREMESESRCDETRGETKESDVGLYRSCEVVKRGWKMASASSPSSQLEVAKERRLRRSSWARGTQHGTASRKVIRCNVM